MCNNYYEVTITSSNQKVLEKILEDAWKNWEKFTEVEPIITRCGHCGVNLNDEVCQDI